MNDGWIIDGRIEGMKEGRTDRRQTKSRKERKVDGLGIKYG